MNKNKITEFLQSVIAIPMLAIAVPLTGLSSVNTPIATLSEEQVLAPSLITTQEELVLEKQGEAIDAFFASYNAPLKGYGKKFAVEAKANDLDWRLLAAISMRESTGGKQACKRVPNSVFGYGSCKLSFKSIDESIEIVSRSIGGNNPKTSHHYEGKTTLEILRKYNSVIPTYPKEVVRIMEKIDQDGVIILPEADKEIAKL